MGYIRINVVSVIILSIRLRVKEEATVSYISKRTSLAGSKGIERKVDLAAIGLRRIEKEVTGGLRIRMWEVYAPIIQNG